MLSEYKNRNVVVNKNISEHYRADIDGMRAIAILLVVGFHVAPERIIGGYTGVDIFFVISGYLITSIILNDFLADRFSFKDFYFRRIRRIFPALITVLTFSLVFGYFVLIGDEYKSLGKHTLSAAGFLSNIVYWFESGYFDTSSEVKLLLHLWSLGIEEQFYIIWPFVIWFCFGRRWGFYILLCSLLMASFLFNIYIVRIDPSAAFYLPIARFWQLFSGCLLAYIIHKRHLNIDLISLKLRNIISFVGLFCLILSAFYIRKHFPYPGWWGVLPTLGAVLLIVAGRASFINSKILSSWPLVKIGMISYPLYLWHWPLLSFARIMEGNTPDQYTRLTIVAISFLLAYLTYRFIEMPFRFGKNATLKVGTLVVGLLLIGLAGSAIYLYSFLSPTKLDSKVNPEIVKAINDWAYPDGLVRIVGDGFDYYANNSEEPEVLFIGDSHIDQYGPRIVKLSHEGILRNTALLTDRGCPPIPNVYEDQHPDCVNFINNVYKLLEAHKSIKTVIVGACWNCYFIQQSSENRLPGDNLDYYFKNGNNVTRFRAKEGKLLALESFREFLVGLNQKYKTYVLLDNPLDVRFSPMSLLGTKGNRLDMLFSPSTKYQKKWGGNSFDRDMNEVALDNELKILTSSVGTSYIEQSYLICPDNICRPIDGIGRPIYKDVNHMRPFYILEKMNVLDNLITKDSRQ